MAKYTYALGRRKTSVATVRLYEGKGEKSTALQYYYKVKDLNPDNKDIIQKIRTLVGD